MRRALTSSRAPLSPPRTTALVSPRVPQNVHDTRKKGNAYDNYVVEEYPAIDVQSSYSAPSSRAKTEPTMRRRGSRPRNDTRAEGVRPRPTVEVSKQAPTGIPRYKFKSQTLPLRAADASTQAPSKRYDTRSVSMSYLAANPQVEETNIPQSPRRSGRMQPVRVSEVGVSRSRTPPPGRTFSAPNTKAALAGRRSQEKTDAEVRGGTPSQSRRRSHEKDETELHGTTPPPQQSRRRSHEKDETELHGTTPPPQQSRRRSHEKDETELHATTPPQQSRRRSHEKEAAELNGTPAPQQSRRSHEMDEAELHDVPLPQRGQSRRTSIVERTEDDLPSPVQWGASFDMVEEPHVMLPEESANLRRATSPTTMAYIQGLGVIEQDMERVLTEMHAPDDSVSMSECQYHSAVDATPNREENERAMQLIIQSFITDYPQELRETLLI